MTVEYRVRPNGDKIAILPAEEFQAILDRVDELERKDRVAQNRIALRDKVLDAATWFCFECENLWR